MTKEQIQNAIITFTIILFSASVIGYFLFPSFMLETVGIKENEQLNFLARALATAFVALIPGAWAIRKRNYNLLFQNVIYGLIIYLILSSLVDFHAYLKGIVNEISIPSIIIRIILGIVLFWSGPRKINSAP